MESLVVTLRQIPFFAGLPREALARVVGKLEQREVAAGQVIFRQGDAGDGLYVVQSGAVEVVLEDGRAAVQSLAVLGPYDCFGEMSLLTGQNRSATVRALVESAVLKLAKEPWDELLAQHPSISLHFCKVLSQRLGDTNWDLSKGRGALNRLLEEVFAAQPAHIQDFLIRTSLLGTLDPDAIQAVLDVPDPGHILKSLSTGRPAFARAGASGEYEYLNHVREFLSAKREERLARHERMALHLRFAQFYSDHGRWAPAIHHSLQGEGWSEALRLLEAHKDRLLERESPERVLEWLNTLRPHGADALGPLVRLRAEVLVRLGYVDAAIRSYQEFLARTLDSGTADPESVACCEELAKLHQVRGESGEARGYLRLGMSLLEDARGSVEAAQVLRSVERLQQRKGSAGAALRWGERALHVAEKLGAQSRSGILPRGGKGWVLLLALAAGAALWQLPPPAPLDASGMHFLASLAVAVILWGFNVFDDHVVAILLLFVWLLAGLAPSEMALAGFSSSS